MDVTSGAEVWAKTHKEWLADLEGFPILTELHKSKVFSIGFLSDGRAKIVEGCDEWFAVTVSKKELKQLASEITELADKMEDL